MTCPKPATRSRSTRAHSPSPTRAGSTVAATRGTSPSTTLGLTYSSTATQSLSYNITGTGSVTKITASTLRLSGAAKTYSGSVTFSSSGIFSPGD
ncbi:MAG TPA: hypothetical protein DCR55_04420 [Lentisphaeria bacterium]|nr:hypothetical protein [Lentisphaeria bacterium]